MQRNIACPCGRVFPVLAEDSIDLDRNGEYTGQISSGSFMHFICPGCGKKHKPEFPLTLVWPSKGLRLEVLPELDRGAFYRRKKALLETETIIGYAELADRIAVISDGLEPAVVETLKYYLLLKAEESYPHREVTIWYQGKGPQFIEFHLHGIKAGEVALIRTPLDLYQETLDRYKKHPKSEIFTRLRVRSYLSVQNMRRIGERQ